MIELIQSNNKLECVSNQISYHLVISYH